jgi:putative membrane protein
MSDRIYRIAQTGILFGLGMYLLIKITSGTLYYYINQRFLWLVAAGALIFLALAVFSWPRRSLHTEHSHQQHHDHAQLVRSPWSLIVLAMPLFLGFLVPARPLDSSALETRGLTTNALLGAGVSQQAVELERPSDQRTILDWVRAFNFETDPSIFSGENADVIGFVYHDNRLKENQFLVGRFAVSCCVADAFAIGLIVETDNAEEWASNSWVHVVGAVEVGELDGNVIPLILAESIKKVPVPPQPYLFPN